jgi:hypothetical protein
MPPVQDSLPLPYLSLYHHDAQHDAWQQTENQVRYSFRRYLTVVVGVC